MIVYKATNRINDKCYVGQTTTSLKKRREGHLRDAFDENRERSYFHWALREYGVGNFSWEILCQCSTQEELDAKEQHYINRFNCLDPDHGYNLRQGGQGIQRPNKLASLITSWKRGTVVTSDSLVQQGYYQQLLSTYEQSEWLERLGSGAYVLRGDNVDWKGALYALQTQLGMTVHVGGRTALELMGLAHFIPLGRRKRVLLISDKAEQLPTWFRKHPWEASVVHHCLSLFERVPDKATAKLDCGRFEVVISSAERAVMEQMRLARTNDDVEQAYHLMEGLSTLRPNVVQELLVNCRSVKVKRLFLWSAETVGHAWFGRLASLQVDLGKGKRQLYKGGLLDSKYQITVPTREELPGV